MPDGRLRRHGKRPRSALPSDSVTRKSLTTERPERYVVPVFRVTFGLHSVVIQPRGQRPTSAMPRPSTPPAAPSTSLFSFPHPSTPRNVEPFGSTALQTNLNPGFSRSVPPYCIRPVALHSARLHRKAANKPQPRFFPFGPAVLHPTRRIAFRPPAPQSRKQTSTPVPPFGPAALHPPGRIAFCPPAPQSRKQTSTPGLSFGPAVLHPTGRTARTGGSPQGCRRLSPPIVPSPLAPPHDIFAPRRLRPSASPCPFARHLRSLDAASSSPPQGKRPDFRSEARFFAH